MKCAMELNKVAQQRMGFEQGTVTETCLQINPPSAVVELLIRKVGKEGRPMRLRPNEFGLVDLDVFDDNVEYDVEIIKLQCNPQVLLHKIVISKGTDGVQLRSIYTEGALFRTLFMNDEAFSGAVVLGEFTDKLQRTYQVNGRTSDDGTLKVVLPSSSIRGAKAKIFVPKQGKILLPSFPSSSISGAGKSLMIEVDPSFFSAEVDPVDGPEEVESVRAPSWSQWCKSKLNVLKQTIVEVVDKTIELFTRRFFSNAPHYKALGPPIRTDQEKEE